MTDFPNLDTPCSKYFTYRQFIECGETWHHLMQTGQSVDNRPKQLKTWHAIAILASDICDPIVEKFGPISLTYGFSGRALTSKINSNIAPQLDQHAGSELNTKGRVICPRLGAACDFFVLDPLIGSLKVSTFIAKHLSFDRLYYYGNESPLHISIGPEHTGMVVEMMSVQGRRMPIKRWDRVGWCSKSNLGLSITEQS